MNLMLDFQKKLQLIGSRFQIMGDYMFGEPYGSGHINDTYAVTYSQGHKPVKYILQRINERVFREPEKLMQNILRVTDHQRQKLLSAGETEISRFCLQLVRSHDNRPFVIDAEGKYWRTYIFIENAHSYDVVETPKQATEAAVAFGRFQKTLVDLPGDRLHEIIPNFHNTAKRFSALRQAIQADAFNRAKLCNPEIAFAMERQPISSVLVDLLAAGRLPERICHNDTKLNNVLLDDLTQNGICVIDLDTVMPGSALYDFGDLVRTSTCPAAEDEKDLSKIFIQLPMFEALAQGYLSEARDFLTDLEKEHLAFSGKLITFEIGLRFLTDFLNGDTYFKTQFDQHNLVRCRTQFRLVQSIEENEECMQEIVRNYL
ncbi:MAG: aminoglycoside phosphotransferase family protein [Desulfobacteraceae bacterium]|nr:MAG: aminoglycoside phosphotransferase family protein [Desulfobacteraceae bacterium]